MARYEDKDLVYAATNRCPCGEGLAYPNGVPLDDWDANAWDCAGILTGRARTDVQHTDRLPFAFYEIKSESQPSASGASTRPK